jgi:UDP-N-acetylglucosamine/UDP-N-acetylgalactosamine diphosphorylase
MPTREELAARLKPHRQEHLLRFWDELDTVGRRRLAEQIVSIDLAHVDALCTHRAAAHDWATLARRAQPAPAVRLGDRRHGSAEARRRGELALADGKIGVVLVSGGQGSRLGFDRPKGLYPIGPLSGASLLELHFEKVLALARRHHAPLPVYMMTSPGTQHEQAAFLAEHDRFDLPPDDLVLFCQGTMPAVEAATGKLLLAAKDSLFLSPDGHGGLVGALGASGALDHMRRRGIEHLFYLQVDNPLVPIGDAEFIGRHLLACSELTSMAVARQTPQDRLGVFATIDGRLHVIEYSDLPDDVAEKRDTAGSLAFWAGSIAVHMFSVGFLERSVALKDRLPFHIAQKNVPYLDAAGRRIEPREPNALKFERFIFDLVPHAENPIVVEYAEQDVFAPLKNAPGEARDTPEYVQRFLIAQHRRWLEAAGTRVAEGVAVEISPLWALDAAAVAARADRPQMIVKPTYLAPSNDDGLNGRKQRQQAG